MVGWLGERRLLPRQCRVMVIASSIVVASCSAPGSALEKSPEVTVATAGAALRAPVWSYRSDALVALTDDDRVAAITDPSGHAVTRQSSPIAAGRNLQISRKDDRHVFVPEPGRGKVAVIALDTLNQIDEFDAGPAPAYLAEDSGMRMLLALSADGSSVTPIDEHGFQKLPTAAITGDPADSINGSNRGREIEYHAFGRSGIRYYKGPSSPPEERGSLAINVGPWAGDGTAVTRSYVAGRDEDILHAVDSRRGGQGMVILATARLSSPIRQIGTDDTRIYAATDNEVAVLETNDVTGYPEHVIPLLRTINYRAVLPEGQRSVPLSGMAIGPHRVYLTFLGTPVVVSVAKPRL